MARNHERSLRRVAAEDETDLESPARAAVTNDALLS